jgi:SpoVK/Ycf46/Vps4 family AAA+-type ATPase
VSKMLLENFEDGFFVLLYLEVGKKDKYEKNWMFTNLFMNLLGSGVGRTEDAERFLTKNKGLLKEVVKRAREFWKERRSLHSAVMPVFIPSFMYFEDEKLREINSLYYKQTYYKKGGEEELKKVYEEYKKLLETEEDKIKRAVLLNNLGCLHSMLVVKGIEKNYQKTMEYFHEASKENIPEPMYNMAQVSFLMENYEASLRLIEEAIKMAPEWAEAHYLKAEVLKNLERKEEAVKEYKKAVELGMVKALEEVAKKELEKLEKRITGTTSKEARGELTSIEKMIYDAYGEIGVEVYRKMDGVRTAEDIMREVGIGEEKFFEILNFLEENEIIKIESGIKVDDLKNISKEKKEKFVPQYDDIIKSRVGKEGGEAETYFERGNGYYEKEDYEKAIENYNMAVLLNPLFSEAYFNRALCYYKLKEYDKSIADYTKAAELDPKNPIIYNNRGDAYYRKQQLNDAIKDFTKAIQLNPEYMKAYYNRGLAHASMENYEKAIEDFSKVIELKPDFAYGWHLRGIAHEYAGRLEEAIRDYNRAVELDPGLVEAKAHLGATKAKMDRREEKLKYREWEGLVEVRFETPRFSFQNVAGMSRWKKRMEAEFIGPLKNRKLAERYGVKSGNILLYGPPGCGKSLIAEAIPGELGVKMIKVEVAEILNMYVGSSERNMKAIFKKAKENQPCVLIFDELEGLGGIRESRVCNVGLVDQFVKELDDIKKRNLDVVVIGTTNMPWMVDSAVLRRFESIVYIPEPDEETREELFKYYTRNLPVERVDFRELAKRSEGMASSNIENICKKAALLAYRDALEGMERKIKMEDFLEAMKEERSAVQLWKEQSKHYNISPMFKELVGEERKEKKETGMYG